MSIFCFLLGILVGASACSLWALDAIRQINHKRIADMSDTFRRAYAAGYDQGAVDYQKPSITKPRRHESSLNCCLLPLIAVIPVGGMVFITLLATYLIAVGVAGLLHLLTAHR